MRKLLPVVLVLGFFALLVPRMTQSMAQSDAYPEWSSLRSDPLGTKVLYLALGRMRAVERNYERWAGVAPRRAQYLVLGVSPLVLQDTKELERLTGAGGVVLLGLRPVGTRGMARTEKLGFLQHPETGLELRSAEWQCLEGTPERCALAERKLGQGRLWMLADGAALRNGELHDWRNTSLVTRVFSTGLPVIFDESHLGVVETGGVGVLLRRYRLFPALAMLLAAALLFVWRSSVAMLPEREPVTAAMAPQPAASLRTLLAQRVPRGKLLETLAAEWTRALPLLPGWHKGRAAEMEAALERARERKDVRQGYAELQAALQVRKGAA